MSSFSQGQEQFRRAAELDSHKSARMGEGHGGPESNQGIARRRTNGYVAQASPQIDADSAVVAKKSTMAKSAIAEKGHFWMETS